MSADRETRLRALVEKWKAERLSLLASVRGMDKGRTDAAVEGVRAESAIYRACADELAALLATAEERCLMTAQAWGQCRLYQGHMGAHVYGGDECPFPASAYDFYPAEAPAVTPATAEEPDELRKCKICGAPFFAEHAFDCAAVAPAPREERPACCACGDESDPLYPVCDFCLNERRKAQPTATGAPAQREEHTCIKDDGGTPSRVCRACLTETETQHGVTHVTPADGNVFEDIGFPPEEAKRLLAESNARAAQARVTCATCRFFVSTANKVHYPNANAGECHNLALADDKEQPLRCWETFRLHPACARAHERERRE